ncbi:MAG: hypothetical protein EON92_10195 [Burkholderiales bacterium]|nr:MAG: hypothetical protein EON92_10195 [Burkholderiales bacterium]
MPIEVLQSTSRRRTRGINGPFERMPQLRPAQEALLRRWVAVHAIERQWQTLLELAGRDQLGLADDLLALLLESGALRVKEQFVSGQWQVERVMWVDLPTLQTAVGVRSALERDTARESVLNALRALENTHSWAQTAAQSCHQSSLPLATLQARKGLLDALVSWQQEQRFGMRRDFSLHARGHTKAITHTEWDWLTAHMSLDSFGIARFAPLLWLGGSLSLTSGVGRIDVGALGFGAVPTQALKEASVSAAPQRYWLIENRASFERQVALASKGDCVIWLPGQPPADWLAAISHLLDLAPAPAVISCDPDPAGVHIALQAGSLWSARGLS